MDGRNKEPATLSGALPKGNGFDKAHQTAIEAASSILTGQPELTNRERTKLVSAFRSALITKRKPGRRPKPQVTAALEDSRRGMRGIELFRRHIRGWENMSRWRRQAESKKLTESIRTRLRRESITPSCE